MAEMYSVEQVCEYLRSNDNFIILTHMSPDGDTLGSAAALGRALSLMGKKVCIRCGDIIPHKYDYLFANFTPDDVENGIVVAVDVATEHLLGGLWDQVDHKVDLCIDHHVSNSHYAQRLLLDSDAAANCEIIYNVVKQLGYHGDADIATAVYTGLTTDTGGFRFSNTTAKTHSIAAEIMSAEVVDCAEINRVMFESKTRSQMALENHVLSGMKFYFDGKCALISVPKSVRRKYGCREDEIEAIASISRSIEGVMVGITLKQKDDGIIKASLRSHEPVDASAICKKLGGGGHVRAAGCTLGYSMADAKRRILKAVKAELEGLN